MSTKAPLRNGNGRGFSGVVKEKYYGNHAWSKLFRLGLLKAYPYPKGKYYEDSYTTYKHIAHSRLVSYVSTPGYYYLQRKGSIVRSEFQRKHLDVIYATQEMVKYMIDNHFPENLFRLGFINY